MPALAFYVGDGSFVDRVIRWVTRSRFSHVEFLQDVPYFIDGNPVLAQAWSSSGRDGGVRTTNISFKRDSWVFVDVPWARGDALVRLQNEIGHKYDFFGLLWSQFFNLNRHDRDRWFCSEVCAHAIGLDNPQGYSPGDLLATTQLIASIVSNGCIVVGEPPED